MPLLSDILIFCRYCAIVLLDWLLHVGLGRRFTPLTEASLLRDLSLNDRRLLLSDSLTGRWWYQGFTQMLKCYREDDTCSVAGRLGIERRLKEVIKNRLAISRRLPTVDLAKCPVKEPIFIIGPMRTGTTFLQNLLYQDPRNTTPLFYELMCPVEENTDAVKAGKDPRVLMLSSLLDPAYRRKRLLKNHHYVQAKSPHECLHLFNNMGIFKFYQGVSSNTGPYRDWVRARTKEEMVEAYRFHRLQLQLILLARNSASHDQHVILKDSMHGLYLDAILAVYPDAMFIHTYRNPCKSLASVCSILQQLTSCAYALKDIGRDVLDNPLFHAGNEILEFRKNHPDQEHRFVDIDYEHLVRSPMDTVRQIYDKFGLDLSEQAEAKMKEYIKENPQNKYGRHHYDLETYGLKEEEIFEKFRDYIEYFNIQC
ncbi:uncharacterized protein LOC106176689 isoform X2 [Lingula anatina]|uniref:Uncharacterized protein LOC106176689 isoform X2 n=1 Tax=Lingula anatina TaxID=7574 RepID=A0A1S3JW84_LINAN|nr:uncharacterized protein LOC106176689 isoform X2 [Lingula anatina]|eukprot:XP_013414628.1 uncharacterized protein LOC106176689 isoform X2 [Lingula anatina]